MDPRPRSGPGRWFRLSVTGLLGGTLVALALAALAATDPRPPTALAATGMGSHHVLSLPLTASMVLPSMPGHTRLAMAGEVPDPCAPQADPVLGAALTIVADGSAPWEDRPMTVPGLGTLPGKYGVADPGDDTGPLDRVVRSWDAVLYQVSYSVRDAPVEDLAIEVILTGPAVWDPTRVAALALSGCPGGATLLDDDRRLRCVVGHVDAPPAVTVALDLTARVSRDGMQGDAITATASVRAPGVMPERERSRCPIRLDDGCEAATPAIAVSAAPAVEVRKYLIGVSHAQVDGVLGRQLTWRLDAVVGADGDVRGTSNPVGAPWHLPDWWQATSSLGRAVDLPVKLVGCTALDQRTDWSCAQAGGVGQPLDVAIERLGSPTSQEGGVAAATAQVVGLLYVDLWVPEAAIQAVGWDVTFSNCYATQVGDAGQAVWAPADAGGQPNIGGLPEPVGNNCAATILTVPRPPRRQPRRPPPPGGGGGEIPPPPRTTPTPVAVVTKHYAPYTMGDGVTAGAQLAAEAGVRVQDERGLAGVAVCDKWDNSTHFLREDGEGSVRVWWQMPGGTVEEMDPAGVVVEYGTGRWGRKRPSDYTIGRAWYAQATSTCADGMAIAPVGWVAADRVDFGNQGHGAIDARDVNMVRARFVDPLPPGIEVWIEVPLQAGRNRTGTWLMNYAAAAWGTGTRTWHAEKCYGAQDNGAIKTCPVPVVGARGKPGPWGDMLVQRGVPIWVTKRNDPVVPGGSPVINAGQTAAFVLEASTLPPPDDPPLVGLPPGAYVADAIITDTLPVGMTYEVGSATIASEDINGNGRLDPGEDRNGNGQLDADVPFEPTVRSQGVTFLEWPLGDVPVRVRLPAIRFVARVSRLVPAGTSLINQAGGAGAGDPPLACGPERPRCQADWPCPFSVQQTRPISPSLTTQCAWAQVLVANTAAAQVEKVARAPVVWMGAPLTYRLGLANLTNRAIEWFDAVDLVPRTGEPRDPASRLAGGTTDVQVTVLPNWPPLEVWASATDPDALDTVGGGARDGLVDPVAAWGGEGTGLGGPEWPCKLADVGTTRCRFIASRSAVTALRVWGPDPQPGRSSAYADSFLPVGGPARYVDVTLLAPGTVPGDLAHNAWGGRFAGLPLPVFDAAVIRVIGPNTATPPPTATPTPTDTPIPPSATPTATASPSPTATATTTPTPTVRPIRPIYLPVLLRLACSPRPVDVVLVIDLSTSMQRSAGDGGTKLDAVTRAARAFLRHFAPEQSGGRVALAAFNVRAWIVQPLTGDSARIEAALDTLPRWVEEGTRLDLGLSVGASALNPVEPGRWRAMVFLTDGMPNWVPTPVGGGRQEDTVLAAAADVRARGITIHTVGYGRTDTPDLADRISPELLRAIADSPAGYHQTDDAGALADVFRDIAAALGCADAAGWP